jgi:hypothetical protein
MLRLTAFIVIVSVTLGTLGLSSVETRHKLHAAEGSQQPDAQASRRKLRIQTMREAQKFFEMIGAQTHCFTYERGRGCAGSDPFFVFFHDARCNRIFFR